MIFGVQEVWRKISVCELPLRLIAHFAPAMSSRLRLK